MSVTSDDIERMLAKLDEQREHCPKCGSTDGAVLRPFYRGYPARFEVGSIRLGYYDDDEVAAEGVPILGVCHPCQHRWVIENPTFVWDDDVVCECEEARRDRIRELSIALSDSGEARCRRCNAQVVFVPGEGRWFHDLNGNPSNDNSQCPTNGPNNAAQYLIPPIIE